MRNILDIVLIILGIGSLILIAIIIFIGTTMGSRPENIGVSEKPVQEFLTFRNAHNALVEYDLDTLKNFYEVTKILNETDCIRETALFKLETEDSIYKIQPYQYCESIFDYKLRQVLYLNMDSITVNYELKLPIDSLKLALKNHLFNPNNDKNYPNKEDKKLISINIDSTENISETKKLLLSLIKELNAIENKPSFSFMFEDRGILPLHSVIK